MRPLIVDNFAGGGGASTGMAWALGRSVDIAINHSPEAVAMHAANHPDTLHYCESVFDVDPIAATGGHPVDLVWFSPDCTHFSKARGNVPVKKEIRGLAWVAIRWALKKRPRVMMLENVEEFKTWGPLHTCEKSGKCYPDPDRAGETYQGFIAMLTTGIAPDHPALQECAEFLGLDRKDKAKLVRGLGYTLDTKELRARDYGAGTLRKRFFMVARCDKQPIVWPKPTHGAPHSEAVLHGELQPWPVTIDALDLSLPCPSIFMDAEQAKAYTKETGTRVKRPLAEASLERIAIGVVKEVLNRPDPFIIEIANWSNKRSFSVRESARTITASPKGGSFALVNPVTAPFVGRQFGKSVSHAANESSATITAGGGGKSALVAPVMVQANGGFNTNVSRSATDSCSTITCTGSQQQLAAIFMTHLRNNMVSSAANDSTPTITAGGTHHAEVRLTLVAPGESGLSPEQEAGAVEVAAFLMRYYSNGGRWSAVDKSLPTVTTKERIALVTVTWNRQTMVIVDIGMRMLTPRELFTLQGFPVNYIIDGYMDKPVSKKDQVARVGNSVPPQFAEALVMANLPELCVNRIAA
ncbi:hypothetical protein AYJ01_00650 [Shewanella algae]|uniref:DNA cytosine methyltransferase n=1 Tax=Shewanella algae TaxID=38313 RepID=UPI0011828B3A|nr:DNA cytosine methyltransferase [Shewanella algae]TVK95332.1 hypothetical protein AYJ01_00650 [Shewanella algae]